VDQAQAAAKYRQSAQACLLKAKRSKNSTDWIMLARKWEALARLCERSPMSNYAIDSKDDRKDAGKP
jgi:hypothetical protein